MPGRLFWIEFADMGALWEAREQHGDDARFEFYPEGLSPDGPRPAWRVVPTAEGVVAQSHEGGGENFVHTCPPDCPNGD